MRKYWYLAVLFFLLFSLTSCFVQDGITSGKDAAYAAGNERAAEEEPGAVFRATVLEVSNTDYLVEPVEGSAELKSTDRIRVSKEGLAGSLEPAAGDLIEITYDGWISETYPAQINHVSDIRIIMQASDENEDSEAEVIEGENFSAQIMGDELILDLKSNATTGYTWVITEEPEQFASDYDVYVEPDSTSGMIGAGGITEFHIIALQEGTGSMIFQYKRNWEGGEIAGTFALTLEISYGLQIESVSFEQAE